jgi:hypothetical protein
MASPFLGTKGTNLCNEFTLALHAVELSGSTPRCPAPQRAVASRGHRAFPTWEEQRVACGVSPIIVVYC